LSAVLVIEAIETWPGAVWLQQSATAYLLVNAAHILGIGILLGGIVPLDLRILGLFRHYPLEVVGPFLTRTASTGLGIAIATGLWLFTVKPAEYLANEAFRWKIALLTIALTNVVLQLRGSNASLNHPSLATRMSAGLSIVLWLSALLAGRWIGFL
jgi:hypothetical protein